MIISTTDSIAGKKVVQTLGVIDARCSMFVSNESESAQKNLHKKAEAMGANAIIGYKVEKIEGVAHAFGTAVIVEESKCFTETVSTTPQSTMISGQPNFCPQCGVGLQENAKFCVQCGNKIM